MSKKNRVRTEKRVKAKLFKNKFSVGQEVVYEGHKVVIFAIGNPSLAAEELIYHSIAQLPGKAEEKIVTRESELFANKKEFEAFIEKNERALLKDLQKKYATK